MNFGRRPSQNPQKLTLAALKFGVGNVKNRRFQLGLVRFLPGFYWNTHREPLNTTTKGFGLKPRRSTHDDDDYVKGNSKPGVFGLKLFSTVGSFSL